MVNQRYMSVWTEKKILDACCGARMFWFDKNHPDALYVDNRTHTENLTNGQFLEVLPDVRMDFRALEFPDRWFSLVVFDPPHTFAGPQSWLTKKYGRLDRKTWKHDLRQGFSECFRVLKSDGVMIFKWNDDKIDLKQVLSLAPYRPLFGNRSGKAAKTIWLTFMKTGASKSSVLL